MDTNVFIKGFEANDGEADLAWSILEAIGSSQLQGLTSELTLSDVLPKPFANQSGKLIEAYQDMIRTGADLTVVPVCRSVLIASAQLRSRHPEMRLPDAIHVATAFDQRCAAFLSNDRRIRGSQDLQIIRLRSTNIDEIRSILT